MNQGTKLSAALAASLVIFGLAQLRTIAQNQSQAPKPTARIGTYDSRAVVVASRNSGVLQKGLAELQQQLKDAQAANDQQRIAQIKARGAAGQTWRHLQAFSNAPIDDILEVIKDQMPLIAQETRVDAIVARTDYIAPGVETVDITDQLVAAFKPDERTLQTVKAVRNVKAEKMVDVLLIKD